MSVKHPEATKPDDLGKAIRKYRKEIGLTQAQFAVALGLAPTSIYRYEAGASTPDIGTLQKLYIHSDKEKNEEAKRVFHAALSEKAGIVVLFDGLDEIPQYAYPSNVSNLIGHVKIQDRLLTPREQLLAVALVLMLRNNLDESSEKMMRLLLEPWMKAAKDEFTK